MDQNHFMEWITVKGGHGSGHWGHSGRPGKRGGSTPKGESSYEIPAAFGGDRERFMAALRSIIDPAKPYSFVQAASSMAWQINKKPEDSGYEKSFQIDELFKRHFQDTPLSHPINAKNGQTDWDLWQSNYEAARSKFTINREEYEALYPTVKKLAERRANEVRKILGLPESVDAFLNNPDYYSPEIEGMNRNEENKKRFMQLYEGMEARAREATRGLDPMEFSDNDFYGVREYYRKQLLDKYGMTEAEYNPRAGSKEYQAADQWLWNMERTLSDAVSFEASHQLSLGKASFDDLQKHGWNLEGSNDDWKPLPPDLWHVTTASDALMETGLKSRYEQNARWGLGLGGGSNITISLSTDPKVAKEIERSLHEAQMVASGKITAHAMVGWARDGRGGVGKNWAWAATHDMDSTGDKGPDWDPFTDTRNIRREVKDLLDYEEGKPVTNWEGRTWTAEDYQSNLWDFYSHRYMLIREHSGGFMNPLFFSTDFRKLAKVNPSQFKTHRYAPATSKVIGWQLSSLAEWRVVGGDTVKLKEVIDYYDPAAPDFMDKIIG